MSTLVVAAERTKARFFTHAGRGSGLQEIRALVHPKSRAHGIAFDSDRQGRTQDRYGQGRHAYAQEELPKDREAANFAREVAASIRDFRTHEHCNRVILMAEPGFLGLLRASLDDASAKLVDGEVHKELVDQPVATIGEHLRDLIIL